MSLIKNGDKTRGMELLNAALAKDSNLAKTEAGW